MESPDEERLLNSVALQNARSIMLARLHAEERLTEAKQELERKSEELARALALTRATLESTADGILVTDDDGKVRELNGKYVEMWQMPQDIVETRDHRQFLGFCGKLQEDPARYHARIDEICATSPTETIDLLNLVDGRVIERFSRAQFIEQMRVGRVWSFRDITPRKLAEEALRQQTERLRDDKERSGQLLEFLDAVMANMGEGLYAVDARGCVTYVNPAAERILGWSGAELIGRNMH
jgi:PAS domain S-box-containing protein